MSSRNLANGFVQSWAPTDRPPRSRLLSLVSGLARGKPSRELPRVACYYAGLREPHDRVVRRYVRRVRTIGEFRTL